MKFLSNLYGNFKFMSRVR